MKFYKRIRKFLVLLCVFTSINTSIIYADINKHFNFKNLTIEDGLSQSTVETIFQDSKGYILSGLELTMDLIDIMVMNLNTINSTSMIKTLYQITILLIL